MLRKILSLEEKLDPKHTALLVIDIQNDFCDANGFFAQSGIPGLSDVSRMPQMAANLAPLLKSARRNQVLIIFIKAIYDPVYLSGPLAEKFLSLRLLMEDRAGNFCLEGSWGADFWGEIRPRDSPRELTVIKHRYSAFAGTELDLILRSNGIRTLVVTGGTTSCCAGSTARDGFSNDYYIVLASECIWEYDVERYHASLRDLERLFAHVTVSSEIIKIWTAWAAKEEQQ